MMRLSLEVHELLMKRQGTIGTSLHEETSTRTEDELRYSMGVDSTTIPGLRLRTSVDYSAQRGHPTVVDQAILDIDISSEALNARIKAIISPHAHFIGRHPEITPKLAFVYPGHDRAEYCEVSFPFSTPEYHPHDLSFGENTHIFPLLCDVIRESLQS